jgi:hypothetical protein
MSKEIIRLYREKDGLELEVVTIYDIDGDETNDVEAAHRILARHPDGDLVVIEGAVHGPWRKAH